MLPATGVHPPQTPRPPESHSAGLSLQGATIRSASRGGNLCLFAPPSPILHCTTHGGARSEGECRSGREIRRAYHPEIKQEHKKVSGEAVSPAVGSAARRSSDVSESGEPPREGLAAGGASKKRKRKKKPRQVFEMRQEAAASRLQRVSLPSARPARFGSQWKKNNQSVHSFRCGRGVSPFSLTIAGNCLCRVRKPKLCRAACVFKNCISPAPEPPC